MTLSATTGRKVKIYSLVYLLIIMAKSFLKNGYPNEVWGSHHIKLLLD